MSDLAAGKSKSVFPLVVASLGVFLGALDQTVVATILPPIITDLEIPFTRLRDAAWIVDGYLLGYTVSMPLIGRLGDIRGRTRVFAGCIVLFGVASVACGAAQSLEWLVVARTVQAVGGGAVLPIALALAAEGDSGSRRGVALGIVGAVAEGGGVLGPLYGAALIQWVSWRWVFYLNLPLSLAIAALVLRTSRDRGVAAGRLDVGGGLLLGVALASLTLALSREGAFQNPSPTTLLLAVVAVSGLAAFVVVERRSRDALIDLALFKVRAFSAANATNLLVGAGLIVAMVDLPLWSATVLQRSPQDGGLLLARMMAFVPIGAVAGGIGTRFLGPRLPAILGLAACLGGFLLLARWTADASDALMGRDLALAGLGFGLLLAPLTTTAIAWAGDTRAGVAASLVTLMRMIGMMVGLSALTSRGLDRFDALVRDLPLPLPLPGETGGALAARQADYAARILDATVTVYHELFLAAAAICAIALLSALLLRLPKTRPPTPPPRREGSEALSVSSGVGPHPHPLP